MMTRPPDAQTQTPMTDVLKKEYALETCGKSGRDEAYTNAAKERWLNTIWPDEFDALERELTAERERGRKVREVAERACECYFDIYDDNYGKGKPGRKSQELSAMNALSAALSRAESAPEDVPTVREE